MASKPDTAHPTRPGSEKTPIAVALRYDLPRDTAPRVVAKGKGAQAEDILRLAFANDIKVREDADLASLLHAVDLDAEIPLQAFTAVAEILAYLYRLNGGLPDAVRQDAAAHAQPPSAPPTTPAPTVATVAESAPPASPGHER